MDYFLKSVFILLLFFLFIFFFLPAVIFVMIIILIVHTLFPLLLLEITLFNRQTFFVVLEVIIFSILAKTILNLCPSFSVRTAWPRV